MYSIRERPVGRQRQERAHPVASSLRPLSRAACDCAAPCVDIQSSRGPPHHPTQATGPQVAEDGLDPEQPQLPQRPSSDKLPALGRSWVSGLPSWTCCTARGVPGTPIWAAFSTCASRGGLESETSLREKGRLGTGGKK
eukprot:CAMPEP_0172058320 /NCGR_PEP_ID=MMETSP1043-20130122/6791_1 /TAXON_ID=464988 /ORGANISM="Hemiselmis andersenii, Strain CCMP441" /LENGTH=138 /DNA_ID=CAMNT_0012717857 /DNA_START=620 /DNA_END=1033 /DNA_ORIENTATION=+